MKRLFSKNTPVKRFLAFVLAFALVMGMIPLQPFEVQQAKAANDHVVISEVYGGGGNSGAPFKNDFIELYNPTNTPVDLSGWSVQYASYNGSSWVSNKTTLSGTIQPYGYFLVKGYSNGTNGVDLPTPDVTGSINLSATAGKVALVNSTSALTGTCANPSTILGIIDFVGYGITANAFETATAPAPSNTNSIKRVPIAGDWDTNNNSADFTTADPEPQNSAPASVSVTGVTLDNSNLTLFAGTTATLTATVAPANATNKSVNWSTGDSSIATVSNGTVTAVSAGSTTITVTTADGSFTGTCNVTVNPALSSVTGVSLDKETLSIVKGDTALLTATVAPADASNKNVVWSSNDETVATSVYGTVYGINAGTAIITVTTVDGSFTDTCNVTVTNSPTISDARAKNVGETVTVTGIITYKDGSNYYIQDETAGIDVYKSSLSYNVGDKIRATGKLGTYNGLLQVQPANTSDVTLVSSGNQLPEPKIVKINQITKSLESQLVRIESVKIGTINTSGNTPITDAGYNSINIYKIPSLTGIANGDFVNVTAVVSYFNNMQLRVRSASDVTKITAPDTQAPDIQHTAVTTGSVDTDLLVKTQVNDDRYISDVKLYYRAAGQSLYKMLNMNFNNGEYCASIPKADLDIAGIEYYIEATDGTNSSTSPANPGTPYAVAISNADTAGPEIINLMPANGINIGNDFKPLISADYSDRSGIDTSKVKIYIDDVDVTHLASITDSKVSCQPETALTIGKHKVNVEVYDLQNNKATIEWNFVCGAYNFYFGQLHSHTNLSDGQGTPDEAFTWARDVAHVDFLAITDHSNSFDEDTKNGSVTDWHNSTSTEWKLLRQKADDYTNPGHFVGIGGFEMTWSGSTGGWGHINTFDTDWFESRNNSSMDLKAYYTKIAQFPNSISQLNHPGKTFGDFADFSYYTPEVDEVVNLIEVGNGEGPIRGSGYFPSYEFYTRALDKGWHVAPTNNQDNHKRLWGNANTGRTVVLAQNLTRESLYDAMRAKRVYATEDQNLEIAYKVNGYEMGSTLNKPARLNLSIDINDPDAVDRVGKVSIIANGGTVVASKNFDSNTAEWNLELDAQYTYYYVRVDEADKDIAVTAPVWTGSEAPKVGFSKIEVSQDPQVINTPVDITATLYNNRTTRFSNVKVEFFKNAILPENKIGEKTLVQLDAANTETVKITWTPTEAGDIKIYARIEVNISGESRVLTGDTTFTVGMEGQYVKVVMDAGHYNQYVSGDYAGKMTALTAMLKEKKFMLVQNKDELTASDLNNAKILILTDPASKNKEAGSNNPAVTKTNFSAAEIQVIKEFVNNGGSLIITSRADYDDYGLNDPLYNSAAQGNAVLSAIGSNLKFNDDEMIDYTSNGGQKYRLYLDDYLMPSIHHITDNIPDDYKYSAYSGCSVILKDGGSADNIEWLVKGHDTTEILDSDEQGDATPVAKGNVNALAAEVLPNGSKIIVAGSTFFSDFELTGDNLNSNKKITENIIDWMNAAELKTIAQVRADANKDGIPDNLGKRFAVEGRVTAESTAVGNKHSFFDVIYVQDVTGGLTIFGVSTKAIPLGTKVKITGTVGQYLNDSQIQISNENTDATITDSNVVLVTPKAMTTKDSMLEENEGWLVKVQGTVTRMTSNEIFVNDGTGEARIFVDGYIGDNTGNASNLGKWDSSIKVGDTVSAIGLASEDPDGHRLRVRNTSEIVKVALTPATNSTSTPTPTPAPTMSATPTPEPAAIVVKPEVKGDEAAVKVDVENIAKALEQAKEDKKGVKIVKIEATKAEENQTQAVKEYTFLLPAPVVTGTETKQKLELDAPVGTISVPNNMFKPEGVAATDEIGISLRVVDNASLDKPIKEKVGDTLVVDLTVTVNGKPVEWKNHKAPITVEMDYQPTADQLKHPEHITVTYIDNDGKLHPVTNGKYNASTGKVTFTTTHFSKYAVQYTYKTFTDISKSFAKTKIEVLASKGIMAGTSATAFSPKSNITRADFIQMLVKALGLEAEITTNFVDVKSTDYYYQAVGVAKELGITSGVGGNKFNPKGTITREDMMVMVIKALKVAGVQIEAVDASDISNYVDGYKAASYAKESIAALANEGIISKKSIGIRPKDKATREEVASILYAVYYK